jgi:hypothetical protein
MLSQPRARDFLEPLVVGGVGKTYLACVHLDQITIRFVHQRVVA